MEARAARRDARSARQIRYRRGAAGLFSISYVTKFDGAGYTLHGFKNDEQSGSESSRAILVRFVITPGQSTRDALPMTGRHVGGLSPGELSHSLMWEAVSSWRAFRIRLSRRAQGRIDLASSRSRLASLVSRCSSDMVCLKRRRFCMCKLRSVRTPVEQTDPEHGRSSYHSPMLISRGNLSGNVFASKT
jgi:hypothetical protein